MADLDERLNQLISDQESMKKVLEMAKAILAQRDSANPAPAEEAPPVPTPAPAPQPASAVPEQDLSAMLGALMARRILGDDWRRALAIANRFAAAVTSVTGAQLRDGDFMALMGRLSQEGLL